MRKIVALLALMAGCIHADTPSYPLKQHFGAAPKTQTITFTNKSHHPAIISTLLEKHKDLGVRGFLIPADTEQALELEEFYWFSRVASGGFGKSQVKQVDILNHGFADTLIVQIPNQQAHTFPLKEDDYHVTISTNDEQRVVVDIEKDA